MKRFILGLVISLVTVTATAISAAADNAFPGSKYLQGEPKEPIPYELVEIKPTFNGGDINEFRKWFNANADFYEAFREALIQGRIIANFIINTDGSVSDVKIEKSLDPLFDNEVIRVISDSPKWEPGKQNGRAVCVSYTFPLIICLR